MYIVSILFILPHISAYAFNLTPIKLSNLNKKKNLLDFPGFCKENNNHATLSIITHVNNTISKNNLLYIPGLDFTGLTIYPQSLAICSQYNLYSVICDDHKNITYVTIRDFIISFISSKSFSDLIIVGESFGALLAIDCITSIKVPNKRLIIINSASSLQNSVWLNIDNKTNIHERILSIVFEHGPNIIDIIKIISYMRISYPQYKNLHTLYYLYMLHNLIKTKKVDIIYRVNYWIKPGILRTHNMYKYIDCNTLIIAGDADNFLPSASEAKLLHKLIPESKLLIIPNGKHVLDLSICNIPQLIEEFL